jgi:guanylate kinase
MSGAGKSTTLDLLSEHSNKDFNPVKVTKYTTRSPHDDDHGEVKCVDNIPSDCDLVYEHYGERYGIALNTLFDQITRGFSPVVILNDVRTVEDVKNVFGGIVKSIFIYREEPTKAGYNAIAVSKGITNDDEIERRFQKAKTLYRIYIENIHLFDHVIINNQNDLERLVDLRSQVSHIIQGLGREQDWPLRTREKTV